MEHHTFLKYKMLSACTCIYMYVKDSAKLVDLKVVLLKNYSFPSTISNWSELLVVQLARLFIYRVLGVTGYSFMASFQVQRSLLSATNMQILPASFFYPFPTCQVLVLCHRQCRLINRPSLPLKHCQPLLSSILYGYLRINLQP